MSHRIESAEKAVALKIEAETPTDWKADGMDLQYINVTAVDKKGRPVWTYNEPLTLQIEGSARLVALDNSDHIHPIFSMASLQTDASRTYANYPPQ